MPPKASKNSKAAAKKVYDYSEFEIGMTLQVEAEHVWYTAEVVQVSTGKSRSKAPVKVAFKGYAGYDEWVGGDRLRSKALKTIAPDVKDREAPTEKKSALLVVDMQNDFMHPQGACAKMGFPDAGSPVVPAIKKLLDAARARKIPVVWINANYSLDVVGPAFGAKMAAFPEPVCVTEWGRQITEQLKVQEGEIQVQKTCYSAFHRTKLAAMLRRKDVDTVVVTGILSSVCVESTARAAVFDGFHTVIAEDAVGDAPEETAAFLKRFGTFFGRVQKTEEICDKWSA